MEALFILIPLSLLAIGAAVWFFFRMSESGQFDDMDSPAYSILLDDDRPQAQIERDEREEKSRTEARTGAPAGGPSATGSEVSTRPPSG